MFTYKKSDHWGGGGGGLNFELVACGSFKGLSMQKA